MSAIFLSNDMMFSSHIMSAADNVDVALTVTMSPDGLINEVLDEQTQLVILDLRVAGIEPIELVQKIREISANAKVVAFGPHIHQQRLASARDANCDEVLTQGQFNSRMTDLLTKYS